MDLMIHFDATPIVETLRGLREALPVVRTRALNRSIATTHTFVARELARAMRLSNKTIRTGLDVQRATFDRPMARLAISGTRLPLKMFKPRKDPLGIRATLPDGTDLYRGAFWATMPKSGHRGIFIRRERGAGAVPARRGPKPEQKRKGGGRQGSWLPIDKILSWSRARTFTEIGTIAEDTQRVASEALVKNIQADVRYMLTRRRGPGSA